MRGRGRERSQDGKTGRAFQCPIERHSIAASGCNGDFANKIGTYNVAILAKEHGIPFYCAAPWSTIDTATATGDAIPIEERSAKEVTHHGGKQLTPNGVGICNPAFDVTPAKYVTAIITERGVLRAPYSESLREMELVAR